MAVKKHKALPVAGYTAQSDDKVGMVNKNKEVEERLLRLCDHLARSETGDGRWVEIARAHFEQGFMALNRSIFQPQRVKLPENN
jgi:hypothetical protein